MPVRILYWNINNFSLPKISVAAPPVAAQEAYQRFLSILSVVALGPLPRPDIFVVVEVHSRVQGIGLEGSVLNPNRTAGQGVLVLLDAIRLVLGNSRWCVVPPLLLGEGGQCEAVAVFYNAATLQFTGPNLFCDRWPGQNPPLGQAQPVAAATAGNVMDYPVPWMNALPHPANPIPALQLNRTTQFMINGGMMPFNEWQLAGQWEYYTTPPARPIPSPIQPPYPPNRIFFPNPGCRSPFWTQFVEVATGRTLNLFTVHTSPTSAGQAVLRMQLALEISALVPPNAVKIVLGDFNVDTYSVNNAAAYNWMTNGQYTMALDPRVNHAGPTVPARKPYLMTHLLPTALAYPFNATVNPNWNGPADPQHNVYPRYGYMGISWPILLNVGAIDNFFTAYGAAAGGPAANITVVNRIVGTPYNQYPAPAGVTAELTGGLAYAQTLANPIPLPAAPPGGVDPPINNINFQAWQNFGVHHSVSDHLPLVLDV